MHLGLAIAGDDIELFVQARSSNLGGCGMIGEVAVSNQVNIGPKIFDDHEADNLALAWLAP